MCYGMGKDMEGHGNGVPVLGLMPPCFLGARTEKRDVKERVEVSCSIMGLSDKLLQQHHVDDFLCFLSFMLLCQQPCLTFILQLSVLLAAGPRAGFPSTADIAARLA